MKIKRRHIAIVGTIALATAGYLLTQNHRVGPADIYQPSWASGAVNLDIQSTEQIAATICNPHWSTKSIRPPSTYTTSLKIQQLKELNYADQNTKDFEEDHLISLELGGSPTSTANLWPEPYNVSSTPDGGAKIKDKVENWLHSQVCSGSMTLQEAQKEITGDWYAVWQKMNSKYKNFGAAVVEPSASDDETP